MGSLVSWVGMRLRRVLSHIRDEHGQVPLEYILLAVLVLGIIVVVVVGPLRTAVTGVIGRITGWLSCT